MCSVLNGRHFSLHYCFCCRYKDTIVLSNGENVAPQPIEDNMVGNSDLVDQVLIMHTYILLTRCALLCGGHCGHCGL